MSKSNLETASKETRNHRLSGNIDFLGEVKLAGVAISTTAAELNLLDGSVAGTAVVNKALALGPTKNVDTLVVADGGLFLGAGAGTAIGATAAELNARCDDSAMSETRTGAGAISATVAHTNLVTTGADALTLAVPTKPGLIKTIRMQTDGGDGTLASTNIVGQSIGVATITFTDVGNYLVLAAVPGLAKWAVIKEGGVTPA